MFLTESSGPREEYTHVEIRICSSADAGTDPPGGEAPAGADFLAASCSEITRLLDGGEAGAAIARKREFEMQISPGLRRSKEVLGWICRAVGAP